MATERSASEVKARSKPVLGISKLVNLVQQSKSPTAAYTVVLAETGDKELAKAGRWLAILQRDYPKEFNDVTSPAISCQAIKA